MKRAKIMLMSIAVLAVVGGALAFKASKFTGTSTFFGCGTTVGNVSGCYSSFTTTVAPTLLGTLTIPYNSTRIQSNCTPIQGVLVTCGKSTIKVLASE